MVQKGVYRVGFRGCTFIKPLQHGRALIGSVLIKVVVLSGRVIFFDWLRMGFLIVI